MDEMKDWEIKVISKMQPWAFRQSSEETRLALFMTTNHKKRTLKAFWPLPTDFDEPQHRLEGDELKDARNRVRQALGMT